MSSARLLESLAGASAVTVSATGAGVASATGAGVADTALTGAGCATEGDDSSLLVAGAAFVTIMPGGL